MSSRESEGAVAIAAAWARTLAGLRETEVQVGWVREQLALVGAARAADVLTIVLARAELREPRYAVLLLRVSLALAAPSEQALKSAIARIANIREQASLARFLGLEEELERERERERVEAAALEGEQVEAQRTPKMAPSRGRPLSLGERKSLARKRDRNLLSRALRDPHPDVVHILLDNPALTELDVVRLCARRPVPQEVLTQVFKHPRWIVRYRIRLTLALNPHTPEPLALQLLPHLTPQDLKEVERSGDVSERVRAACSSSDKRVLH